MKVVIVLALLVACEAATRNWDSYDSYNRDGFRRVGNGISAPYSNDDRQRAVNRRAEHKGASSGTAKYDDVPGTNRDFGYGGYDGRFGGSFGGRFGGSNGGYNDGRYGGHNDGRYGRYNDGHHVY